MNGLNSLKEKVYLIMNTGHYKTRKIIYKNQYCSIDLKLIIIYDIKHIQIFN